MKICFILTGTTRRNKFLNGETLRYGGAGASGTDSSVILVGEYLAKIGHEVVISTDGLEPELEQKFYKDGGEYIPGKRYYGVSYTNLQFEGIEDREFDVLVNMLWYKDYNLLPIKVTKALIYWCHMQWFYSLDEHITFCKENNLKFGVITISDWQDKMVNWVENTLKEHLPTVIKHLIPNPIFDELINEVKKENIKKQPGKFIYHSTWTTGGNVAYNAFKQVNVANKEFHALDYFMVIDNHTESNFYKHDSCDRKTVYRHIAESEYFINPLYTIHKNVRKDTFSLTIAESIALGCIVLTYPLGALPGNYKDYCAWLEFPPGVDVQHCIETDMIRDEEGKFTYTQNIVDKIHQLENSDSLKAYFRRAGQDYIMNNFNLNTIGKKWEDFLSELI